MAYPSIVSKRLLAELQLLTTDSAAQSYFHYESSGYSEDSSKFQIYGYLLPQSELYKYGSFKVLITFPLEYPFKPPELQFLNYIYHKAFQDNTNGSKQKFCKCWSKPWRPVDHTTEWLKECVKMIDGQIDYCELNLEAKALYDHNRVMFEERTLAMIEKYSYPRSNQSLISLKFAVKQKIRQQLDFKPEKIDQLLLPNSLKQYLNPSLANN